MIKIIAIIGKNGEMGMDNDLLEHFPADMKHFKETTKSHIMLLGSSTYNHLPESAKPFPDRYTIVLTSQPHKLKEIPGEMVAVSNYHTALKMYKFGRGEMKQQVAMDHDLHMFIAGGAKVYADTINKPSVREMVITRIHREYPNATHYFPDIDLNVWELVSETTLDFDLTLEIYHKMEQ